MNNTPASLLARLAPQLARLEKRDWELWAIVSGTGILVSLGLLAIVMPAAFLSTEKIHFEITVSRPMAVGLVVLIALLNTYLVSRRLEVRRLREQLISSTLQKQLIEQQSFTDPLTELYNRRSLEETAGRFIGHARRLRNPLTFLMVDVNNFKMVNTRFGHLTGDTVLAEIASILKGSIRGADAAVRYGGDEFLILLANTTADGATNVIERINKNLADWNAANGLENFELSLSIGAAEWRDGQALAELLDSADHNMYQKKTKLRTKWKLGQPDG